MNKPPFVICRDCKYFYEPDYMLPDSRPRCLNNPVIVYDPVYGRLVKRAVYSLKNKRGNCSEFRAKAFYSRSLLDVLLGK